MNTIKKTVMALGILGLSAPAQSFDAFSRACNMLEVDGYRLLRPALKLFNLIGMPDKYLSIPERTHAEKRRYWVNESFTTDIAKTPTYYLYAESRVYQKSNIGGVGGSSSYQLYRSYQSGLDSKRYSELTRQARELYAVTSRHLIFFARAGEAEIMDHLPNASKIMVFGHHYAISPLTVQKVYIANSKATTCNPLGGIIKWPL